jgi:hypothetical protein
MTRHQISTIPNQPSNANVEKFCELSQLGSAHSSIPRLNFRNRRTMQAKYSRNLCLGQASKLPSLPNSLSNQSPAL